jgi:hypothetical protein
MHQHPPQIIGVRVKLICYNNAPHWRTQPSLHTMPAYPINTQLSCHQIKFKHKPKMSNKCATPLPTIAQFNDNNYTTSDSPSTNPLKSDDTFFVEKTCRTEKYSYSCPTLHQTHPPQKQPPHPTYELSCNIIKQN